MSPLEPQYMIPLSLQLFFFLSKKVIKGRMIAFVGESLELNGMKQCWLM